MSDDAAGKKEDLLTVASSRFGELEVSAAAVIDFPVGIVGFPRHKRYIMVEHKPPFCWLQSVDDPNLAFVIVDGMEFGEHYQPEPPRGDAEIDLQNEDEFAILVIVTVRSDPRQTTANLKAPLFVNLRNRRGIQVIYDDPKLSTRYPLWGEEESVNEGSAEPPVDEEA